MAGWPVGYLHNAVEGLPRTNPDSKLFITRAIIENIQCLSTLLPYHRLLLLLMSDKWHHTLASRADTLRACHASPTSFEGKERMTSPKSRLHGRLPTPQTRIICLLWFGIMAEEWVSWVEKGKEINLTDRVLVGLLVKDLNSTLHSFLADEKYQIKRRQLPRLASC